MQKEEIKFDVLLRNDVESEGVRNALLKYVTNRIGKDNCMVLLAEKGDEVVGLAIAKEVCYPTIYKKEKIAYLENLFVVKKERRKGIGSKLMNEMEMVLKNKGFRLLELDVYEKATDAHRFYERRGFSVIWNRMRKSLGVSKHKSCKQSSYQKTEQPVKEHIGRKRER
jgi:GNAT superfamily N-acetyltransferase